MSEEIDRLTHELERAHAREARLKEDFEAHRKSAQQWQTRAEEAERELSRIQGEFPDFNNAWRAMGQAFANVTGQVIDDNDDVIFLPGDEGEIDYENQDLNPAGQGEREAHPSTFGFDRDIVMTDDEITPVSDQSSMRRSNRGSQDSGHPFPYDPKPLSHLESDLQHGSSLRRSSLSGMPGLKSPFEPSIRGLEDTSLQRPPPPPPSSECSQPLPPPVATHSRPPPHQPSLAETISPVDCHAAPSHVAGGRTDVTNRPEHHANMHEELPAFGEISGLMIGDSLEIPEGPSQIPEILTASAAPPIPKRPTPTPAIRIGGWDLHGAVMRKRTHPSHDSFFEGWPAMPEIRPKPRAMDSVAAGKQPERPLPAKEAPSATRVDSSKAD